MVTTCQQTLHDVSYREDRLYLVRRRFETGILTSPGREYVVRVFPLRSKSDYVEYYVFRLSGYDPPFDHGEWFEGRRTSL